MDEKEKAVVEVWLPAAGYENHYEVSNLGNIRRHINSAPASGTSPGRPVKPVKGTKGYKHVTLSAFGEVRKVRVNRLILSSFCGPEPFEGAFAAHNNGNQCDNRLANLRWATPKENQWDRIRHNTKVEGEQVHNSVLKADEVRKIRLRIAGGERNPPIATDYGVSISTIHLIRHGRIWKHVK